MDIIPEPIRFEWDKGNIDKNLKKHGVTNEESEEVFSNQTLLVNEDPKHSTKTEKRYYCLGRTNEEKLLFVSFTLRGSKVRIISARVTSRKEKIIYEKEI